jgi:hypothetical protein
MIAVRGSQLFPAPAPGTSLLATFKLRVAESGGSAAAWVRHTLCGVRGHAMLRHFESTRLSLQCMNCGVTTPGWTIRARS